jgi:hypothetical protein
MTDFLAYFQPLWVIIYLQHSTFSIMKHLNVIKEIIVDSKHIFFADWMECVDNTSGYPYYWNRETNEVKWDRPSELPPISTSAPLPKKPNLISNQHASNNTSKTDISSISKNSKVSTIETKKVKKKSRSATPPQVFIGPTLPQLTPEEIARSKVIKFEESMAQEIQKDILKEEPLDWVKSKVHRGLYSKPFAWKKSAPCTSTYNDIQVQ